MQHWIHSNTCMDEPQKLNLLQIVKLGVILCQWLLIKDPAVLSL